MYRDTASALDEHDRAVGAILIGEALVDECDRAALKITHPEVATAHDRWRAVHEVHDTYPEIWRHLDRARRELAVRGANTVAYDELRPLAKRAATDVDAQANFGASRIAPAIDADAIDWAKRAIAELKLAVSGVDWKAITARTDGLVREPLVGRERRHRVAVGAVIGGFVLAITAWLLAIVPEHKPPRADTMRRELAGIQVERKSRIDFLRAELGDRCLPSAAHDLMRLMVLDGRGTDAKEFAGAYTSHCGDDAVIEHWAHAPRPDIRQAWHPRAVKRALLLLAVMGCRAPDAARAHLALLTTAEQSHWLRTGRYDEAVQLCHDFARAYAGVTCDELGRTFEDRPIIAVRIERALGAPYIYIQAGVHAGEIEGKDAGFWFLRDLLDGKIAAGALDAINVVFVPCINPDGHERFGANNRPNQRGPEEMGFRTNSQRFNLNRDFVKADTPEVQAVLGVIRAREPVVVVDLHTTDGAKFEHDIAIDLAPVAPRADHLEVAAQALSDAIVARMTTLGHLPIGEFYPQFVKDEDPTSGFAIGEAPPRFSQIYAGLRGSIGMLVETHSWRTYAERGTSVYHTLQALFELAITQAPTWSAARAAARTAAAHLGGSELAVVFDNTKHARTIAFRGYHYESRISELTGGTWITYDESKPEIWNVPLYDEVIPKVTAHVPRAGYIVEGGFAALVRTILDRHGIAYTTLTTQPRLALDVFRTTKVTYGAPYEGHTRATFEGAWATETRTLDRGAIFVPIAQPLARVIVHLLDPAAPDSLAQWGFFNTAFERKEYMEAYVAEEAARAMIAKDPKLVAQFQAAVAADPALASPDKKLEWFYRHTPAWDERFELLPIYRTDVAPL